MHSILSVFLFVLSCSGFVRRTQYPFLFIFVLNKGYVPDQRNLKVCAAIELVEDQFYLLPKVCFDNPLLNMRLKAALLHMETLSFKLLSYKGYVLRLEKFSEYVVLEKTSEEFYTRGSNWDEVELNQTIGKNVNIASEDLDSDMAAPRIPPEPLDDFVEEKQKRYVNYSEHFIDPTIHRMKRKFEFRFPPFLQDESKLPPRVLLTIPNSTLLTDCYVVGWGTYFRGKSMESLNGLKMQTVKIPKRLPGVKDPITGLYFGEIWFERDRMGKYPEDLGTPMLCKAKDRNVDVIIGIYTGGNTSFNREFDFYRSFMGELSYITRWALGTNVSTTGDPAKWTLWPVKYRDQPRAKSAVLQFNVISCFIIVIKLMF